jgi:ComF family protein
MAGNTWYRFTRGLFYLFFPRLCVACGSALRGSERILCLDCVLQLPETGYHDQPDNETVMRLAGRFPFQHATSYGFFTNDSLLQHVVHQLKYANNREAGIYLGERFGIALRQASWIGEIDLIVPVPLHKRRLQERGYNQSVLLAEGLSRKLNIPCAPNALVRNRQTESQTKKSREERLKNMAAAFSVTDPEKLKGKHILLIDDVLTTGATIESCALALLAIEGVRVSVATIGIAI